MQLDGQVHEMANRSVAESIDEYIAEFPLETQRVLEESVPSFLTVSVRAAAATDSGVTCCRGSNPGNSWQPRGYAHKDRRGPLNCSIYDIGDFLLALCGVERTRTASFLLARRGDLADTATASGRPAPSRPA